MANKKNTKSSVPETTYILDLNNGQQRKITVPSSWKVTFGPVVIPRDNRGSGAHISTVALRFYEGNKENQRAIFTDVKAFRDSSIKILEKRAQVKRQHATRQTPQGAKEFVVEAKIEEWVNPDKEDEDAGESFKALPDFTIKETKEDDF